MLDNLAEYIVIRIVNRNMLGLVSSPAPDSDQPSPPLRFRGTAIPCFVSGASSHRLVAPFHARHPHIQCMFIQSNSFHPWRNHHDGRLSQAPDPLGGLSSGFSFPTTPSRVKKQQRCQSSASSNRTFPCKALLPLPCLIFSPQDRLPLRTYPAVLSCSYFQPAKFSPNCPHREEHAGWGLRH